MPKEIRISTIYTWIITQTLLSIIFYLNDNFVSGGEAIIIFLLSIPFTMLVQWLRDLRESTDSKDSQDDSEISQ
jgi:hypothetical protein